MGAYSKLFKDTTSQYHFSLHAPNGERILHSEGYLSRSGCLNGITSVKTNSSSTNNFEIFKDKTEKHRFRLLVRNGEIIGHGEAYVTMQGCQNGIASVMKNAPAAEIITHTK